MASQIIHFSGLSDRDRKAASPLPKLVAGDRLELRIRHEGGTDQTLSILAAAAVEALLAHMLRIAVLAEHHALSPTEASAILGISRPLVVLRMDRGDLPFRYVGKHRRALFEGCARTEIQARHPAGCDGRACRRHRGPDPDPWPLIRPSRFMMPASSMPSTAQPPDALRFRRSR